MARRGSFVAVAALCSLALTSAVVTVNGPHTAPNRAPLATGPGWRIDGASSIEGGSAGSAAATGHDQEWLVAGVVPGAGTPWASMVRFAMIDLHQLTRGNGAVAAGAAARWGYAWPRDMAFVAVAMARTGHRPDALRMLTFLQRVQAADGGFEARYRLDGSGPPDDRPGQSDGAGWALWAMGEVLRAGTTPPGAADLRPLRALLDRSSSYAQRSVDDGRRLPPPSPDYWEVPVARTSLGTVAPMLAGLRASARLYDALGEPAAADRSRAAADGLDGELQRAFTADGYQRLGRYGGRDASVTFLMPPFADEAGPGVERAWEQYQREALRPAGGLAPGAQWKKDGASWTPETAMVAYTAAASGHPLVAEHWMTWLDRHCTTWGSLPEKVLPDGRPAGPAPLAWTAALVVLTETELAAQRSGVDASVPGVA
jgi:GH15 family glucan-1,4-alpha-glucosidase